MSVGMILLGLALLIVVVAFIARPFWMRDSMPVEAQMTREQALEAEKAVLLDQIRALDFDLETGKLPADVHQSQRARLVAQAAALLQQLDQADDRLQEIAWQPGALPDNSTPAPVGIEAEIEAALARVRQARATQPLPEASMAVGMAAAPPAAVAPLVPSNGSGRFCPQCGQPRESEDKFCAYCGRKF